MSPERLLNHFEQICEAPDAVPRLRRFILDLAVRGKLVGQDPGDEPAAELLNQIAAKRGQIVSKGSLGNVGQLSQIKNHELPFALPSTWVAARMDFLAVKLGAGSTPLGGKSVYQNEGIPFLRSQNVHDNGLRLDNVALIPESIHERMSGTHLQENDILLNITGASIGRCALLPKGFKTGNVSQHVAIIRLVMPEIRAFIHLSLISPIYQKMIMEVQVGVSREGLSMQRLKLFPMALPPVAEQKRIVDRVDELMALCDKLEAAQAKRQKRRDRLVAATLHGLNNGDASPAPSTPPTFKDSARFYLTHLPRLTTRPEHIQQLRQTILNLAVRGKLVPQESNDGPASELLKRVEKEKERLIKIGRTPKTPFSQEIKISEIPYELPEKWQWVSLKDLGITQTGNTPSKNNPEYFGGYIPFVKPADLTGADINYAGEGISREGLPYARLIPNGSILMVCIGSSIGKVNRTTRDICCNQQINTITPFIAECGAFIALSLKSSFFQRIVLDQAGTGTLPIISKGKWEKLPVPLPPLAEQHRIVAKVDEMLALCKELEAGIATTTATRFKLLEASLQEAISL